jgi:hypothetical protein
MIRIFKDGTVQLKGKPALALRMAIAGIREGASRVDCDDWECALAEFIDESIKAGEITDELRDQDIIFKWRDQEFHLHVDGYEPDRP